MCHTDNQSTLGDVLRFAIRTMAFAMASCWLAASCTVVDEMVRPAGNGDDNSRQRVGEGLREALMLATERAGEQLHQPGGYLDNQQLRIPLPPRLQDAATQLRRFGLGGQADKLQTAMNRAAETAANEAVSVFASSIRRMSPSDALGILNGGDNAATQYLRRTSEDELRGRYRPIVANHLERVQGAALYADIARSWNRLPGVKPLEADLESFVTDKALDGLFFVIAREEQRIRSDPVARTTELLRDVFGNR